jgi:hypothetical protein
MDVREETCHRCGATEMKNLVAEGEGTQPVAFVACAACGELVARYGIVTAYRHGAEFEGSLRSPRWASAESGKATMEELGGDRLEAEEQYATVLAHLEKKSAGD